MTLEELKSLRPGEVVVFTKVNELITEYNEYELGDELEFMNIQPVSWIPFVNFYRKVPGEMGVIAHFSYSVCDYIERKVLLERDKKLNILGI
jgi:hypothetical protein